MKLNARKEYSILQRNSELENKFGILNDDKNPPSTMVKKINK